MKKEQAEMWFLLANGIVQSATTSRILLPKGNVLHKTSGLVMQYVSEYKPANNIASITVSIPMTRDICYLIPLKARRKIPQCNITSEQEKDSHGKETAETGANLTETQASNHPTNGRNKRFVLDIISLALGTAATTLSTSNTIQIANLQKEVRAVTTSIEEMKTVYNRQNSQIIHLAEGQKESAEALHHTQTALNNTIAIVNEHSNELKQNRMGIKTLLSIVTFLKKELSSFTHAVETHFLHESIEDILANKLNLRLIHHYDLPRVLKIIAKRTNVQMDDSGDTLPMIELINRLLVHQRIDYLPGDINARSDRAVIGNLLFVSFFASASKDQQSFSTYQLLPIPFNHGNQRAKVAQLPQVIGISIQTFELIQWTKEESETCKFEVLSSCRETPPIRRQWEETCLFEILTDTNLTLCRVEYEPEPIFVHRIGQQWAISTRNETKCHRVTQAEQERHVITTNNQISIPPTALISVEKSTALSCDHFFCRASAMGLVSSFRLSKIERSSMMSQASSIYIKHWSTTLCGRKSHTSLEI